MMKEGRHEACARGECWRVNDDDRYRVASMHCTVHAFFDLTSRIENMLSKMSSMTHIMYSRCISTVVYKAQKYMSVSWYIIMHKRNPEIQIIEVQKNKTVEYLTAHF